MSARRDVILMLLLGGMLLCGPPLPAQEEEDLTAGLRQMHEAYERARRKSDELDFAGAIRELDALLDPRREVSASDLSLEELNLVTTAYDLRARAQFNLGNAQAASEDYKALLRLDPSFPIDRQSLSPKVVDLFDRVRRQYVAILVLDIEPRGAHVFLDKNPIDPAVLGNVGLLAGRHEIRVEKDGFDPYVEWIMAVAGAQVPKSVRLRPNRRSVEFITVPAGTTIKLDDAPVGTTWGPPTPEVAALAERFQFDPRDASAPLPVPLVTPGEHHVTFERECYMSRTVRVRVELDPEHNSPLRLSPVVLKEARTDLLIRSIPSGATVLVDGANRGTTPLTVPELCGGERDVLLFKEGAGSWSERVRLTAGQVNTLDARLRPTLLYAGTFRLDEWGRAVWSDQDAALLDQLNKGLKTLNVVRSADVLEEVRAAVIKWMIANPVQVRSGTVLPPAILKLAARRGGADLVLAGLTLAEDPDLSWTLALYSVLHDAPDLTRLRTDRVNLVSDFVARLDNVPPASEAWWGMSAADTSLHEDLPENNSGVAAGPVVARVLPGSPAANAGLRAGDRIGAVETRRIRSVADLTEAMAAALDRPGGVRMPVTLTVGDQDTARTVRLAPGESPVVIPSSGPGHLYNRLLAEYRLLAKIARDDRERGIAYLNLGIAYMHFREYDRALAEGFSRASLPQGSGVSEGTVLYYRGLCALRKGDPGAARKALEAAARAPTSTVESGDGPSAAAGALRLLQAMR